MINSAPLRFRLAPKAVPRRPEGGTTVLIPPSPAPARVVARRWRSKHRCAAQARVLLRTDFDFLSGASRRKLCEAIEGRPQAARTPAGAQRSGFGGEEEGQRSE